jgi:hypothetical protein
MSSEYTGTDPVIKRIHENLNKILWICKYKMTWSAEAEKKTQVDEMMGAFKSGMNKSSNPFGGF